MNRDEALIKLRALINHDIRPLTDKYQVTVWRGTKLNKGWAGQVLERYLGLPPDTAQSPNFGNWELKVIPLHYIKSGTIDPKETMAITMIDARNILNTEFENSHLFAKLIRMIVCARMFETKEEKSSILVNVVTFNLDDPSIIDRVKSDYNLVRQTIERRGFNALTGKMGDLVQPRTKGTGYGSRTRAFYARKKFLRIILNLNR